MVGGLGLPLGRIIPARAGNALPASAPSAPQPDHPRTGGERANDQIELAGITGSSPHGRGTRHHLHRGWPGIRIIPARAGNAVNKPLTNISVADHPRTGGERSAKAPSRRPSSGSSPHGRGTRAGAEERRHIPRIIPARAGNAHVFVIFPIIYTDHPRTGGERELKPLMERFNAGSSPHGRGTLVRLDHGQVPRRIIPARAGNAPPAPSANCRPPDHPRTGGERASPDARRSLRNGSSPHGRGTPLGRVQRPDMPRIIPARAGNAGTIQRTTLPTSDHPRTGGERGRQAPHMSAGRGSSPHGRGTHKTCRRELGIRRIIPARAGNALATTA